MNAGELQDLLRDLLEEVAVAADDPCDPLAELGGRIQAIRQVCSFEDAGVLTMNMGLVIECEDRTEFQVTIVQSR